MPEARLSVVMPVFNAERYVVAAAQSILRQTFGDFEFIVIDDGSVDHSRSLLEELARRDRRIRLISRGNTGVAIARQEGLLAARGEFLASMDADDISEPTRFARQLQWLADRPDCLLVGTRVQLIDPDGAPLGEYPKQWEHDAIDDRLLQGDGAAIHQSSAMMRRAAALEAGGYRQQFPGTEDLDLFLRLAERGRIANLPELLHRYRLHFSSLNRTRLAGQMRDIPKVVAEARARRGMSVEQGPKLAVYPPPAETEQRRRWARQLRRGGHWRAAARHAALALAREPLSLDSVRLLYHLARGR